MATEDSGKFTTENGTIRIADDVVSVIAGLAAGEVAGVSGMSGGVSDGISQILGRKNLSKGIKVEVLESGVRLEIYLVVEFGYNIQDVCNEVQSSVKSSVENMTGLTVTDVDVYVQSISFPKESKAAPAAEEVSEEE